MSTERNKNNTIEYINKQQKNVSFGRNWGGFREYQYVAIPSCYTRSIRAWFWC